MKTSQYGAPWGRKIWVITGAVTLLGLGSVILLTHTLLARNAGEQWVTWILPLVFVIINGGTALWMIRAFEISDDAILVRRSFWVNRIPLPEIRSAEIDPDACRGAWKTMGNDGLFAMHGRFRSKRLGKFQAYVTSPKNSIVLKVPGDTIVISPENPRSFLNDLNRRLHRVKGKQ